jgi:hypothetical protein
LADAPAETIDAAAESPQPTKPPLWAEDATLTQRLRALPPHALADRQTDLHVLRARLISLRARLRATPRAATT